MNSVKLKWDGLATPLKTLAIGLSVALAAIVGPPHLSGG
jgi:hypothetical protein